MRQRYPQNLVKAEKFFKKYEFSIRVKRFVFGLVLAVVAIAAVIALFLTFIDPFQVSEVSTRKGTQTAAIFLDITNRGLIRDCVVGVEVTGEGKMGGEKLKAELHRTVLEQNIMKMVKVEKICVEPLSTVRMKGAEAEGYHIMVFGDVEKFDTYHVHLVMESGRVIHFDVEAAKNGHSNDHKH